MLSTTVFQTMITDRIVKYCRNRLSLLIGNETLFDSILTNYSLYKVSFELPVYTLKKAFYMIRGKSLGNRMPVQKILMPI